MNVTNVGVRILTFLFIAPTLNIDVWIVIMQTIVGMRKVTEVPKGYEARFVDGQVIAVNPSGPVLIYHNDQWIKAFEVYDGD